MRRAHPVSFEQKEQIHFGTLQTQAREVIAEQAQHTWTDTAEHDPGITLLDAMAYNVSDLAYRHLLPIEDLLAPPSEKLVDEKLAYFTHQVINDKSIEQEKFKAVSALSADGNILAVLLSQEVQIFERVNDKFVWRQTQPNPASPSVDKDRYGYSIGISSKGDRIAIAAPDNGYVKNGRIYIFERNGLVWQQLIDLQSDTNSGAELGTSLTISADGKTVASAAKLADCKVYIHKQSDAAQWQKPMQLISGCVNEREFGYSLCLSPNAHWLAIANKKSIYDDQNQEYEEAGAVYLYEYTFGLDEEGYDDVEDTQKIFNPNPEKGALFGSSLDFDQDGEMLAIGAPGTSGGGTVYLYRYKDEQWELEATLQALDVEAGEGFGHVVRFGERNTLVIGTYKKQIDKQAQAGAVYIFRFEEGEWVNATNFAASTVVAKQEYGQSIAISADDQCLVVGAHQMMADNASYAGASYTVIKKENLFPAVFGPHQALTCSPITVEDYRRALLDLRQGKAHGFYFRNVQLKPIQKDDKEIYQYGYNADERQFTFQSSSKGIEKKFLLGDYILYIELNRYFDENWSGDWNGAKTALDQFLLEHRNLGEAVRVVKKQTAIEAGINASIEVDDDIDDIAPILAQIYTLTENYFCPPAVRARAKDLIAQGWDSASIYQGPKLEHGWITQLPPERNYSKSHTFQLTPLVKLWESIPGVRAILKFGSGQDKPWELTIDAGQCAIAFSQDPIGYLAEGKEVRLSKRGRQITTTSKKIYAALPSVDFIDEMPVTLAAGRYRHPRRYHPVSLRLPACYQLQNPAPNLKQTHLHQFLLAFEQQLANGCDQLAGFRSLLSFVREAEQNAANEPPVWGAQWPFNTPDIPNEVPNEIHAPYRDALEDFNQQAAANTNKELEIIDYLLSYFGERRAARTISPSDKTETWAHDFLSVQRGYLQNITDLTYHRAAIRIDQVSALERRIAARLGWAPVLFESGQTDLTKLPFYIVERRALLPKIPKTWYDDHQNLKDLQFTSDGDNKLIGLIMTLDEDDGIKLEPGQLIDFVITNGGDNDIVYATNCVSAVKGTSITFLFTDNRNLQNVQEELLDALSDKKLHWQSSDVWLYGLSYPLQFATQQTDQTDKKSVANPEETKVAKTLLVSYFPTSIKKGATLHLEKQSKIKTAGSNPSITESGSLQANVTKIDPLTGEIDAQMSPSDWDQIKEGEEDQWSWYFINQGQGEITDHFSFMVSVVLNRALLENVADKKATAQWMQTIISEEMPAYIVPCLHWMDKSNFEQFALVYDRWQNGGQPLGDSSYHLLELLGIGRLSEVEFQGIGNMHIATEAQQKIAMGDGDWNPDYIQNHSLLYVPDEKEATQADIDSLPKKAERAKGANPRREKIKPAAKKATKNIKG